MKFLTFTLAGPMVSFGETERWDHRGTEEMPTKSAIIGLLGCCMGLRRGDDALRQLGESLHLAVRRDKAGTLLTDYHTVQNPDGMILNTYRKPRGSTIVTPKQYIQDVAFQVFLYGDEDVLNACAAAMLHPKWVVCLGRNGNPPSVPVRPEVFEASSVEDALSTWVNTASARLYAKKAADAHEQGNARAERLWRDRLCEDHVRCEIEDSGALETGALHGATYIVRHDAAVRADVNRYEDRRVVSCVMRRNAACI